MYDNLVESLVHKADGSLESESDDPYIVFDKRFKCINTGYGILYNSIGIITRSDIRRTLTHRERYPGRHTFSITFPAYQTMVYQYDVEEVK